MTNFSPPEDGPMCEYSTKPPQCKQETIHRGKTSIFIFEGPESQNTCAENVRNEIKKQNDDEDKDFDDDHDAGDSKCSKTVKRSAKDEDETIIVVKKRGDKVFIEI